MAFGYREVIVPQKANKPTEVQVTWKGLNRGDVDDLYDFLRSHESVATVYSRVQAMDAAFDPKLISPASIVAFLVLFKGPFKEGMSKFASKLVDRWIELRFSHKSEADSVIVNIHGPDNEVISRVARRLPKVKE